MQIDNIMTRSEDILTRYYRNEIKPFLDSCDEDIIWIGPAENQIIKTRKNLINTFAAEENNLTFALHDLTVTPVSISSSAIEILMFFLVDTFWPDGSSSRVYQRIQLSWGVRKGEAKIRVCHISDAICYDARDTIYPLHYDENFNLAGEPRGLRLNFRGKGRTVFYLDLEQLIYAETQGNHTLLHTTNGEYESIDPLARLEARYGEYLVRSHQSYLVNPSFVQEVRRFELTLEDGKTLPIPEKKYTVVKSRLMKKEKE